LELNIQTIGLNGFWAEGQQQQIAKPKKFDWQKVTITMPIHPFYKQQFSVVQVERGLRGQKKEFITVTHPIDGLLRLPIAWTDHASGKAAPTSNGQEVLVTVSELLRLASTCAIILDKELDFHLLNQAHKEKSSRNRGGIDEDGKAVVTSTSRKAKSASRDSSLHGPQNTGTKLTEGGNR